MRIPGSRSARRAPWLTCLWLLPLLVLAPLPARAEDEPPIDVAPIDRDTETSKEHFEDGVVAAEEGRSSAAADAYWKAVETDLLHYRAHVRYQQTALAAGDPLAELKADYEKFISDYPTRFCFRLHRLRLEEPAARLEALAKLTKGHEKVSDLHLEIGRAHLAAGDAKKALAALAKAQALKRGERPDILLLLAEAEHAAGKSEDAIKRLEGAVKTRPEFFEARIALARLQLALGAYAPSAENADVVIKQRPSYVAAFLVRSEALVGLGKDDDARAVLKSAYRVNKENNDVVIAYADLMARFETEAALKQATQLYGEVLARDEENWRALYGLGWALERMEKFEEAEERYRQVAAVRPTSAPAINSVGYVLFKQGRVSEAQVQFKRAIDLDPQFVTARANLGATFDAQAKYAEAIEIYEAILKLKGHKDNLRALINCAFDYEATASFPKAMKLLLRAHELLPQDANIVVWLGDNAYFQRKFKDALKWYQEAIALDEKSFFAWRGLGLTYAEDKEWNDAVRALERASKLKPDEEGLYVLLGDIYWLEIKDLKSALAAYEEYIQRGGTDPEVREAIVEIRKELEKK